MLFTQTPGWISTGTNLHVNSFTTNVGIGTAVPACRLEVWKSSSDVNYPNVPCLGLFNDNSSGLSKSEIVFGNAFTNLTSTTVNPHWAMGIDPTNEGKKDFYWYCVENNHIPLWIRKAINSSFQRNSIGINGYPHYAYSLDINGASRIKNPLDSNCYFQLQHDNANVVLDVFAPASMNADLLLNYYSNRNVSIGNVLSSGAKAGLSVAGNTISWGNVGIGTNAHSTTPLEVVSHADNEIARFHRNGTNSYLYMGIHPNPVTGSTSHFASFGGYFYNSPTSQGNIPLVLNAVGAPVIIGDINTINASDFNDYKLQVRGKIRATGVKIYTTWADYVFDKDYKLMPIQELADYVQTHKHLPNIPTAKEVEKEGIEVGSTQAKLLEKIEELTLYIIQQQKELNTLKQELETLKNY